jgi:hypothetical protein
MVNSSMIEDPLRIHQFMTSNPVTKVINSFPNKLTPELISQVEIGKIVASGAHAKVY